VDFVLGPARFDARTGDLVTLGGASLRGPRLTLWRAPTDNDLATPGRLADAEAWRADRLHGLQRRVVSVTTTSTTLTVAHRYGTPGFNHAVDVTLDWWSDGASVAMACEVTPHGSWTSTWARIGLEFDADVPARDFRWTGAGPGPAYPDTGQAQRLGHWAVQALAELQEPYVRPQESGARRNVTALSFSLGETTVRVQGGPFAFTAMPWSTAALAAATHTNELEADQRTHLVVDLAQHGVGTASCGPGVFDAYVLTPRPAAATLVFSAQG
jgi:beta-galactosidase